MTGYVFFTALLSFSCSLFISRRVSFAFRMMSGWVLHLGLLLCLALYYGLDDNRMDRSHLLWGQWLILGLAYLLQLQHRLTGGFLVQLARFSLTWPGQKLLAVLKRPHTLPSFQPLKADATGLVEMQFLKKLKDWPWRRLLTRSWYAGRFKALINWLWSQEKTALIFVAANPLMWIFLWQFDQNLDWASVLPPAAYDVVDYHGPMIAHMLQNSTISFDSHFSTYVNFYPKTAQIFYAWQMMFEPDFNLLGSVQLPFLVLAVLALYNIMRMVGIGRWISLNSALLFMFMPVVIKQTTTAYVDVTQAALFLAAAALCLKLIISGSMLTALAAGVALGLLGGIKSTALLYTALLLAVTVSSYGLDRIVRQRPRRLFELLPLLITALLLSTVWLAENQRITGNPFYPISLPESMPAGLKKKFKTAKDYRALEMNIDNIYGYRQTAGMSKAALLADSVLEEKIGINNTFSGYDNSTLFGGSGLLVAVFLIPALLTVLLTMRSHAHYPLFVVLALLLVTALVFQPLNFRLRFIIALFGLMIPFLGLLWQALPAAYGVLLYILLTISSVYTVYTANLDEPTPLRGRGLQTPRIIAAAEKLESRLSKQADKPDFKQKKAFSGCNMLFKNGYVNHPPVRELCEYMHKKKLAGKTLWVSRYYRYPSLFLWGRWFNNRVNYFEKASEISGGYVIGYPADSKGGTALLDLGSNMKLYRLK